MGSSRDLVIVGGCGRAGLPLGAAFADRGLSVTLVDTDQTAVDGVNAGIAPFRERGLSELLPTLVTEGRLEATVEPAAISHAEDIVVTIGTEVDRHLNPDPGAFLRAIDEYAKWFVDGQLLVLRSTVFPGVTKQVEQLIDTTGKAVDVAFCPERIAEGNALEELTELPEIIGARHPAAGARAERLFQVLTPLTHRLTPEEAELAKLFSNAWRYLKFSIANQLFMMANDAGLDYERIRLAMAGGYERAADIPSAGYAAGPCLFKDTMQLAAFNNNNFTLGHAGMLVNEGLPLYVVSRVAQRFEISRMTVGLLGMAFKGDSDDTRSSLSYKLKRLLELRAARLLCTDPYVTSDPALVALDDVLAGSDLLVIGAPHSAYRDISVAVPVVDIWNLRGDGVVV